MFAKKITYEDFNGNSQTEVCNFNLSQREIVELQGSIPGGFGEAAQKAVEKNDIPALVKYIETLIQKAYGVKSTDGKRFIKNDEVLAEFVSSAAYDALYDELLFGQNDEFVNFFKAIIPESARAQVDEAMKQVPLVQG